MMMTLISPEEIGPARASHAGAGATRTQGLFDQEWEKGPGHDLQCRTFNAKWLRERRDERPEHLLYVARSDPALNWLELRARNQDTALGSGCGAAL